MTVEKYIRLAGVFDPQGDKVEMIAILICELFDKTEDEVDNLTKKQFIKLSGKVGDEMKSATVKPLSPILEFAAFDKINFGHFVDTMHFMKMGEIDSIPHIACSIWDNKLPYKDKLSQIMQMEAYEVIPFVTEYMEAFAQLIESYPVLFAPVEEDEKKSVFIENFGWIFAAKRIAEHQIITLDQAFELPVVQALNALAYLKSEQEYLEEVMR